MKVDRFRIDMESESRNTYLNDNALIDFVSKENDLRKVDGNSFVFLWVVCYWELFNSDNFSPPH